MYTEKETQNSGITKGRQILAVVFLLSTGIGAEGQNSFSEIIKCIRP